MAQAHDKHWLKQCLTKVRECRTNTLVKTETLVARVTPELAQKVYEAASAAGEAEAYVIREALREYFARRASGALHDAPDHPALPPVPPHQTDTTYHKRKRKKKP